MLLRGLTVAATAALLCGCAATPAASGSSYSQISRPPVRPAPATVARSAALPVAADFAARALAAHNQIRAAVGVPALQWDIRLAAGAQNYGPLLAAGRQLVHSPRATRPGIAENLWMGTAGAYSVEAMIGNWGEERRMFRPGVFPAVSTTGNWLDVSHYTQMIWRATTHVGCAVHRGGGADYLVCRYSPSGNRDGLRVP